MSEPQRNGGDWIFSSDDCLVVLFEGPGENIRRTRRLNNPHDWPRGQPVVDTQPPADTAPLPPDKNPQ